MRKTLPKHNKNTDKNIKSIKSTSNNKSRNSNSNSNFNSKSNSISNSNVSSNNNSSDNDSDIDIDLNMSLVCESKDESSKESSLSNCGYSQNSSSSSMGSGSSMGSNNKNSIYGAIDDHKLSKMYNGWRSQSYYNDCNNAMTFAQIMQNEDLSQKTNVFIVLDKFEQVVAIQTNLLSC